MLFTLAEKYLYVKALAVFCLYCIITFEIQIEPPSRYTKENRKTDRLNNEVIKRGTTTIDYVWLTNTMAQNMVLQ